MRIIIWGAGRWYQKYKSYLDEFDCQFIVENDKSKHGQVLDGKKLVAPDEVEYAKYDYVVILISRYESVYEQLLDLGVEEKKLITVQKLNKIVTKQLLIRQNGKDVSLKEWQENTVDKKVLIVSHNLSRTGVPVACMNMALLLMKLGYVVLYMSFRMGGLKEDLEGKKIDYIVDEIELYKTRLEFLDFIEGFSLIVLGTAALNKRLNYFASFGKPVLWWIHESKDTLLESIETIELKENVHCYAGGPRVASAIKQYTGIMVEGELLYFLYNLDNLSPKNNKVLRFAMLGAFDERKAQDLLLGADDLVPLIYKENYEIVFVGAQTGEYFQKCYKKIQKKYPHIKCLDEMSQEKLDVFYEEIDVLVCPSRDDPMPIVVTQAMQHNIPCIISSEVGQCYYITHGYDGFIFQNENAEELAQVIVDVIKNREELSVIGNRAKQIFESNFSEKIAKENISIILEKLIEYL